MNVVVLVGVGLYIASRWGWNVEDPYTLGLAQYGEECGICEVTTPNRVRGARYLVCGVVWCCRYGVVQGVARRGAVRSGVRGEVLVVHATDVCPCVKLVIVCITSVLCMICCAIHVHAQQLFTDSSSPAPPEVWNDESTLARVFNALWFVSSIISYALDSIAQGQFVQRTFFPAFPVGKFSVWTCIQ